MGDKDCGREASVGTGQIKISTWLGASRTNVPIVVALLLWGLSKTKFRTNLKSTLTKR